MSDMPRPDWPDIWFLRHGQTEWNLEGRIQGHLDSPLTALGRRQARDVASVIAPIAAEVAAGPGGIYVSPLGRARETAALALPGIAVVIDPRLAEIASGAWERCLKADLPRGASDMETYTAAPGGEGFAALMARVRSFGDDLAGPSIVIGHGMWGQVLRGLALGLDRAAMGRQDNVQGCVYHLCAGREWRLMPQDDIA